MIVKRYSYSCSQISYPRYLNKKKKTDGFKYNDIYCRIFALQYVNAA